MLRPILITPPAVDLLVLSDVKAHLRVDSSDDDALITALIAAATAYLDGYAGIMGRCLINQTWKLSQKYFGGMAVRLPFPDVSSVTVKYYDASNSEQTVSSANYQLLEDDGGSLVEFYANVVPPVPYVFREDAVNITLVAGYGAAAANVPQAIRQAMLLLVADWYDNRQTMQAGRLAQLPFSVEALLAPFKRKAV